MSSGAVSGPMIGALFGTAFAVWISIEKQRDGGFVMYTPPRVNPHILKKMREENPAPEIQDLSQRYNRIIMNRALLSIDYDNLHLYGIK